MADDKRRPLPDIVPGQMVEDDTTMGVAWVYCRSHVGPHSTGWCTVPTYMKVPLAATDLKEALDEVRGYGWCIHGDDWP